MPQTVEPSECPSSPNIKVGGHLERTYLYSPASASVIFLIMSILVLPLFLILYLKRINGTFGTHGTDGTHGALVPAAVLDGLPVEGPRDLGLGVAPHVADEAHVTLQDLFMVMADDSTNRPVVNPLVRNDPTGFDRSHFTHEYSISCLRDILLKYLKPQGIPSCCQQGLGYLAQLLNHFCQSPICLI